MDNNGRALSIQEGRPDLRLRLTARIELSSGKSRRHSRAAARPGTVAAQHVSAGRIAPSVMLSVRQPFETHN